MADNPLFNHDVIYGDIGDLFGEFIEPAALDSFKTNGFYSTRPYSGLKIISVNNNMGTG